MRTAPNIGHLRISCENHLVLHLPLFHFLPSQQSSLFTHFSLHSSFSHLISRHPPLYNSFHHPTFVISSLILISLTPRCLIPPVCSRGRLKKVMTSAPRLAGMATVICFRTTWRPEEPSGKTDEGTLTTSDVGYQGKKWKGGKKIYI